MKSATGDSKAGMAEGNNFDVFIDSFIRPISYFIPHNTKIVVNRIDKSRIDKARGVVNSVLIAQSVAASNEGKSFTYIPYNETHFPFRFDEDGELISPNSANVLDYAPQHRYMCKIILKTIEAILAQEKDAVIVLQGDHGLHMNTDEDFKEAFGEEAIAEEFWDHTISAVRIPEKYRNGEEEYALSNPLNISRYLVNSFVGRNYEYLPPN